MKKLMMSVLVLAVILFAVLAVSSVVASAQTPTADNKVAVSTPTPTPAIPPVADLKNIREKLVSLNLWSSELPKDLQIVPTGTDAPTQLAQLGRVFTGAWNGYLASMLVIEQIYENGKVDAVYCWQQHSTTGNAGCNRYTMKFKNGKLAYDGRISLSYQIDGKQLRGSWQGRGTASATGTFTEVLLP